MIVPGEMLRFKRPALRRDMSGEMVSRRDIIDVDEVVLVVAFIEGKNGPHGREMIVGIHKGTLITAHIFGGVEEAFLI